MKTALTAILALALAFFSGRALAHHGWAWTTGENMELTGVIKEVGLGNPHGILEVEVGGSCGPSNRSAVAQRTLMSGSNTSSIRSHCLVERRAKVFVATAISGDRRFRPRHAKIWMWTQG